MAEGAVSFLLTKVTDILLQSSVSLLRDNRDELEETKLELESMRSYLKDAERRKGRSAAVDTWLGQVRDVAYEAEDIIDEFMNHKESQLHGKMHSDFLNLPKNMVMNHSLSSKLQKIKSKVHEIYERGKRYEFQIIGDENQDTWQHHGQSSVVVEEDDVVGMDENRERLLKWLAEDDPRRTIISIVGMGGLGKTTLATRVFNDSKLKHWFNCLAWVHLPQVLTFDDFLRTLMNQLVEPNASAILSNLDSMNAMQLGSILMDYLHQKRYLIVLDDVLSIPVWSRIRNVFPNNKLGSRIILTTRNQNVASSVGVGSRIYRLEPLQESDAWILFTKKAFWSHPDHICPRELEAMARSIVKKCEGLPLAIVAIGGLMSSRNQNVMEWKKVYESLNWQLSNNPMLVGLREILLLSFNDLPFYLKHCFLHCCVFRDGCPIKRKKLIRLWVAEGFANERKGMTMEEVAEEYLRELILRSMIQVTETNDAGRVKTCRVHDVMHELAMTTSEKENFCTTSVGTEAMVERRIQRLSIYNEGEKVRLSKILSRHLRSLFVFDTGMCSSFSLNTLSDNFKFLRVLDLEGVSVSSMPDTLVDLFNLRYLNLRRTNVCKLPKSMDRLRNLQTLDVRSTNIVKLPSGISKLHKLRHLFMHQEVTRSFGSSNCQGTLQAPKGIWNLRNLQTLTCIELDDEIAKVIGNLTKLKRLDVVGLRIADGPKLCCSIEMMEDLVHLGVKAVSETEQLQLESLSHPPTFLGKLTLVGKLQKVPDWIYSLVNLTHLYLACSQLDEKAFSSLHLLSTLVLLELKKAFCGNLLHLKANCFTRLVKLNLLDLDRLDCLLIDHTAMPNIRGLSIAHCQELKQLPQGLEHLTSLQNLQLEEMPAEFVEILRKELREDKLKLNLTVDRSSSYRRTNSGH